MDVDFGVVCCGGRYDDRRVCERPVGQLLFREGIPDANGRLSVDCVLVDDWAIGYHIAAGWAILLERRTSPMNLSGDEI